MFSGGVKISNVSFLGSSRPRLPSPPSNQIMPFRSLAIECDLRVDWPFLTLNPVTCPVLVSTLKSVMSDGPLSRVPQALPSSSASTSWIHRAPIEAVGHPSDQSLPSFHARSVRAPARGMSYSVMTTRVASPVGRGCSLNVSGGDDGPRTAARYRANSSL